MSRQNTRERRRQIANAMLRVMSEHGYVRASIKKIADEAGITPGLVHYHFKTKQQILLQLVEDLGAAPIQALDNIVHSEAAPEEKLQQIVDSFLATGSTADPDLVAAWVVVSGESVRQPEVAEAFGSIIARIQNTVAEVIRDGVATGEFALGLQNPTEVAAGLIATIQGYYTFAAASRELVPPGSAARVAHLFLGAISTRENLEGL